MDLYYIHAVIFVIRKKIDDAVAWSLESLVKKV